MIQLTRLRHDTPFYLNPDLIERIDSHVDTVVRLTNGTEYVVNESGDEIVRRTADFRARVIALAGIVEAAMGDDVREQAAAMAAIHANPAAAPTRPDRAASPIVEPDTDTASDSDADIDAGSDIDAGRDADVLEATS